MAGTAIGRCANWPKQLGYHQDVEGQSHGLGNGSCSIDPVKCEDRYLHGTTELWMDEISLYSTLYEAILAIMGIGDGVPDKSGKRE